MRIVIDMQGAQAENRHRGIGRYATSIVRNLIEINSQHEIVIILNSNLDDSIRDIKLEIGESELVSYETFSVVDLKTVPVASRKEISLVNDSIYQEFVASIEPDVLYLTSIFEGFENNATCETSKLVGHFPIVVMLYDLIPEIYPDLYLTDNGFKFWYKEKLSQVVNSDLVLSISESSRNEGYTHLNLPEEKIVNVSTDADSMFTVRDIDDGTKAELKSRLGIEREIVMYTGGIDHRKNLEGLIYSYSKMPGRVREKHQLVIVCSIREESRQALLNVAKNAGLNEREIVFTGYISDEDLVNLYNICKLFVFPSIHEGFGLPVLEAMRCGAPAIASNSSSIPEVVGNKDALFDANDVNSIAALMLSALEDASFLERLSENGIERAKHFSWHTTARKALEAIENCRNKYNYQNLKVKEIGRKPKLAYISPIQGAKSGIADYSAELLPHLADYYDIDVVVSQSEPVLSDLPKSELGFENVRNVDFFKENVSQYERIVYHFGNSPYHNHMFELLESYPGVVVLHDFFLSNVQEHREIVNVRYQCFQNALFHSHGYKALGEFYDSNQKVAPSWKYPANLSVIQRASKVIVHSENSKRLLSEWYGSDHESDKLTIIPHLRTVAEVTTDLIIKEEMGFSVDDIVVCSFGMLGPTKQNHRLLDAWLNSSLGENSNAHLIFVGQNDPGDYGSSIEGLLRTHKNASRVKITGWADTETFRNYLKIADIGVQLRTLSRGETSGTVLDCMNYELATIVNANGSMADLDAESVIVLDDEFSDDDLKQTLQKLVSDEALRKEVGVRGRLQIESLHDPKKCSRMYAATIEEAYRKSGGVKTVVDSLSAIDISEEHLPIIAKAISQSFPPEPRRKQLLVDISELVQRDAKTGIQRVVRSVLKELITNPPQHFDVQPVYASIDRKGYRYARRFMSSFLEIDSWSCNDEPVEAWKGDVFIGLDLQHHIILAQESYLQELRDRGVFVSFVVYDLLPVTHSEYFVEGAAELHENWLNTISQFDSLICISQSVEKELVDWLEVRCRERKDSTGPETGWFHLGADMAASKPSSGISTQEMSELKAITESDSFLMVGTLEPRKGHAQVLDAFDLIWQQSDLEPVLVIVGKAGWKTDKLRDRIVSHERLGKTLFWFEQASDELLEELYDHTICLIAASYGEGFGLPLIEASQFELPILARDIPVFREVAGEHASYFSGEQVKDVASSVLSWIKEYHEGIIAQSGGMKWLTWSQSARNLSKVLLSQTNRYK